MEENSTPLPGLGDRLRLGSGGAGCWHLKRSRKKLRPVCGHSRPANLPAKLTAGTWHSPEEGSGLSIALIRLMSFRAALCYDESEGSNQRRGFPIVWSRPRQEQEGARERETSNLRQPPGLLCAMNPC